MARLQRLVLQGFKSFKRRASIPFPEGFSAITGPNGSGKSNIGDAISFVLGTSSSKSLRAKRGEELIFHGSKNKSASDFASVTLYLDNSKKELPFKEKEVTVSRRVNKKGVSTYRLNGRVVTRQHMVDILYQAGIRSDGHNMIQQGDVTRMVEMDPIQRRGILDEISGIKEYDEKRAKAIKELDRVAEKVREAEILLTEKGSMMEKLRTDRDAALEVKNLQDELEKVKISILLKDYSTAREQMDTISKDVAKKEKEFAGIERNVEQIDKRLEKEERSLQMLTKEVMQASSQIEVSRKIAHLQSSIDTKKERVASFKREAERLDGLIERVSRIENKINPGVKEVLSFSGVSGVLLDLVVIPREYRIAADVGAGGHFRDVVVDRMETAVRCVKHLKAKKLGRARFLPLNKMMPVRRPGLPPGSLGWMSDLVHYDKKFAPVMEYVFGRTACVKDIETARTISQRHRVRMVTLDGDLVEATGAVTGGYYRKAGGGDVKGYLNEKQGMLKEVEDLEEMIAILAKELNLLAEKERKTKTFDVEKERQGLDKRLMQLRDERKKAYEQRLGLQQEIGRLNIQKAKMEARFDSLKIQVPKKKDIPYDRKLGELRAMEKGCMDRLGEIGPVNMKAIDEFDSILSEFEEFKDKVDKIAEEREVIHSSIEVIDNKRLETFMVTLTEVAKNFRTVYRELTGGDAELVLEDPRNIETGLLIKATPPGKKLLTMDAMSGGEKTLAAFTFLFALQKHQPAPFYVLDEADAALDKINTDNVVKLLRKQSKDAQFIIISHNDNLVREADQIFGVTMDQGESKVMGVELPDD